MRRLLMIAAAVLALGVVGHVEHETLNAREAAAMPPATVQMIVISQQSDARAGWRVMCAGEGVWIDYLGYYQPRPATLADCERRQR